MKTLVTIVISIFFGILTSLAQTETIASSTSEIKVKSKGDHTQEDYYRTYAFLDLDGSYRIKIKFMKHMTNEVKDYLISEFGEPDTSESSHTYIWEKGLGDNYVYEAQLKGNRLRINFNKESTSEKDVRQIEKIAEKLKAITARPE